MRGFNPPPLHSVLISDCQLRLTADTHVRAWLRTTSAMLDHSQMHRDTNMCIKY